MLTQQANQNNSKLFAIIAISILITGLITGLIVYFLQKSANEKVTRDLELKISSLEKQISTRDNTNYLSTPESPTIIDQRDCIAGEIWQLPDNFPIGMSFQNMAMSGETGVFKPDGSITLNWGRDYVGPNDERPSSGIGKWSYQDGLLTLSDTTISDEAYSDLRIFSQNGDVFVIPKEYTGMIIGYSMEKVDIFYEKNIKPMWDLSVTPKLDRERCEELKNKNQNLR